MLGEIGFIGLSFWPLGCAITPGPSLSRGACAPPSGSRGAVNELRGRHPPFLVAVAGEKVFGVAVQHRLFGLLRGLMVALLACVFVRADRKLPRHVRLLDFLDGHQE